MSKNKEYTENKEDKALSQCISSVSNGNTINRDAGKARNRARSWCFTLNNYIDEDVVTLSQKKWNEMKIKKYVFQEEIGKNNNKHLQGVVQFENQVSFSKLKEFHDKIHWEKCKNLKASIKYCSKQETRAGRIYTEGNVDKHLWKDKKIEIPYTQEEMNKSMLKQYMDEIYKNTEETEDDIEIRKEFKKILYLV